MSVLAVKINLCNTLFPYGGDYMDKDNERILLANVIGECIKSLQLDKNINQKELALLSGVSERSLRRIERGQVNVNVYVLRQLVTALGGEKAMTQAMRDSIASGMSGIRSRMEQFSSEEIHLDTGWPLHLFFERTIYIDRDLEPMAAAIVRRTLDIIVEEEQEEEKR